MPMTQTHFTKGCSNAILLLSTYRAQNSNNGAIVELLTKSKRHVERVMSFDLRTIDPTKPQPKKRGK